MYQQTPIRLTKKAKAKQFVLSSLNYEDDKQNNQFADIHQLQQMRRRQSIEGSQNRNDHRDGQNRYDSHNRYNRHYRLSSNSNSKKNIAEEQQDSGFKAWQADSTVIEKGTTNLLRNFNSQLENYQQKYNKNKTKTIPIRLPSLKRSVAESRSIKRRKKDIKNYTQLCSCAQEKGTQNSSKDERKSCQVHSTKSINKSKKALAQKSKASKKETQEVQREDVLLQAASFTDRKIHRQSMKCPPTQEFAHHKSSELQKKPQPKTRYMHLRSKLQTLNQEDSCSISMAKVHQMKFVEQADFPVKRIRKRDIYLSIFGDKGKSKVQKHMFDDQNQPYIEYMQRKKQQLKNHTEKVNNNRTMILTSSKQFGQLAKAKAKRQQRSTQIMRF